MIIWLNLLSIIKGSVEKHGIKIVKMSLTGYNENKYQNKQHKWWLNVSQALGLYNLHVLKALLPISLRVPK